RTKARVADVRAELRVADLAVTAGAVAPAGNDDHVIALAKTRGSAAVRADPRHDAGDLVARNDRRGDVEVAPEISIDELGVGAADAAWGDPDQELVGPDLRNRDFLEDQRLTILMQAGGSHVRFPWL